MFFNRELHFCEQGTTYKRVNPVQEINYKERDKFWEKEEQEERRRQEEERQRREEEKKRQEKLLRERDVSWPIRVRATRKVFLEEDTAKVLVWNLWNWFKFLPSVVFSLKIHNLKVNIDRWEIHAENL